MHRPGCQMMRRWWPQHSDHRLAGGVRRFCRPSVPSRPSDRQRAVLRPDGTTVMVPIRETRTTRRLRTVGSAFSRGYRVALPVAEASTFRHIVGSEERSTPSSS